jgi:hypothetical protein
MCTGRDLIARVVSARLSYAENLVSGDLLGACGVRVCSGRSCVRGAQVRRGYAARVWTVACVRGVGAWRRGWAAYVGGVPLASTRTRVVVARAGMMFRLFITERKGNIHWNVPSRVEASKAKLKQLPACHATRGKTEEPYDPQRTTT